MNFDHIKDNDLSYYVSKLQFTEGIKHGFCDASLDLSKAGRSASFLKFKQAFDQIDLELLKQNHTDRFQVVSKMQFSPSDEVEADAFIIPHYKQVKGRAFGVISADCIPLILRLGDTFSIVHSGWRGLANGILVKVLNEMRRTSSSLDLEVLIGPCAGSEKYEVGYEVIEAIGENAVYRKIENDKILLSLTDTARQVIKNYKHLNPKIYTSGICVISNTNFFSHRRGDIGRNLSFLKF